MFDDNDRYSDNVPEPEESGFTPAEESAAPVSDSKTENLFGGEAEVTEEYTGTVPAEAFEDTAESVYEEAATESPKEPQSSWDSANTEPAGEPAQAEPVQPEPAQSGYVNYGNPEYSRQYDSSYQAPYGQQGYGSPQYNQPYSQPYNEPYGQYRDNYAASPAEPQKPKKSGKKIFLSILALVLVFALGVGVATILQKQNNYTVNAKSEDERTTGDTAEVTISGKPTGKKSASANGALTPKEIAEKVRSSNVGIVVYSSNSTSASGEGSGIIMGEDSTHTYTYVITCAHVIKESGIKVTVQTESGESYDAEIVGFDIRTDIGVVKIKKTGLEAAEFGNSEELAIGDAVYAVGNPGGVEFFGSFTGGFVSAINRPVSSEIGYTMKCIQHDAAINPGNSGGMLINEYGQVVGINSQKIASTNYEGMGFAIPITSAKEIIDDLIKYSYIPNRPKLGITYYPVTASTQYNMIARVRGLPAGTLIINQIDSESSLNNTKVQRYDMITAVNGKDLTTADVLLELIDNGKVGDKLRLTICRVSSNYEIETFDVEATLVEDRGDSVQTTTQRVIDPFEYFYGNGNSGNNPFGF